MHTPISNWSSRIIPGYQSLMKDLKQSTKQRFGALDFNYPAHDVETEIVTHESKVSAEIASKLVSIAERARNLKGHGLDEGISTRMLIYAGNLIAKGVEVQSSLPCSVGEADYR